MIEKLREKLRKSRRRALNFLRVFFVKFVASALSLSGEKVRLKLIHQTRRRAAQLLQRQRPAGLHPIDFASYRAKAELVIFFAAQEIKGGALVLDGPAQQIGQQHPTRRQHVEARIDG